MLITRSNTRTTSDNLAAILALINDPRCKRIVLFASPLSATEGQGTPSDGLETNFPLVAALADVGLHGIAEIQVVFDGNFLHATRIPRYEEVRRMLDAAQDSGKVFFATERVPFTAAMESHRAASVMADVAGTGCTELTGKTRAVYFGLLSDSSES